MILPRSLAALVLAFGSVAAVGCAAAPRTTPLPTTRIAGGPGSLQQARQFLEGRWSLLSFEVYPPGGQPVILKGTGTLTYDNFGNLAMELRTDEATAQRLAEVGLEMPGGALSTSGRTAIDLSARKLTYILEGQPAVGVPYGPLATNRPRYWEVDGDVLTLTTRDESGKALSVGKWKRAP